jgi:hypothetical protein
MRVLTLLFVMITNIAFAKDIPVITRFDESTVAYQALSLYVKEMNISQQDYNFVIRIVPGALGENADLRSLSMGKEGEEHVLHSTLTSYTSNLEQFKNSWDREKSFIILKSFWVTTSILTVNPEEKGYNNFVNNLKNKEKIYYGSLTQGGNRDTLAVVFLKHYNLENKTKVIRYSSSSDLNRALLGKEVDFAISVPGSEGDTRGVLSSGENTNEKYKKIPTGKEIGIEDFYNETMSMFSVPATLPLFADKIKPIFGKMCNNQNMINFGQKVSSILTCRESDEIRKQITFENIWVKKYQILDIK